jgi:thiamine biosynthesis lipoprotein ApbE
LEDSGVKQLSGNTIQFLEKVRKYSFYTDGKKDITLQAITNGDYDNL